MNTHAVAAVVFGLGVQLFAIAVDASDAFVCRFVASSNRGCDVITWADDLVFYNRGAAPATVRFIDIDGVARAGEPAMLELPANRAVSVNDVLGNAWGHSGSYTLSVLHLDVPDGVVVESRDELRARNACINVPLPDSIKAKVSMPVFRAMVPPGVRQVVLGTDLGSRDARLNVGIYNAGDSTASAVIEIHRACDDSLSSSKNVTIPPHSTIQFGGFAVTPDGTCREPWLHYTVVTVDQPSLSYVANVTESQVPTFGGLAPTVDLAVAHNVSFP